MFDLGLELIELFQVRALRLCGGKVPVPRCRWDNVWRCGIACPLVKRGTVSYPFILIACAWHPESDVEALASGIVSAFIVRVGVAEAVVAHGHEAAHGFRVAKPGEVHSDPRLVLLRGVSVGVCRTCGDEVEAEMLVASLGLCVSRSVGRSVGGGGIAQPEGVWGWCRLPALFRRSRLLRRWRGGA